MTRPLRTRRLLAAVAVTPLLPAGLVACGSDADDASSSNGQSTSETSTETPAESSSDDLEEGEQVEPADFIATVAAGLEESTTARVTLTSGFGGTELTGDGEIDYTTTPPSVEMVMQNPMMGEGGTTEVRSVDGIMYLSLGQLTGGKFWRIDPSDPDGPLAGLGLDRMVQQTDPVGALQAMEPGIEQVVHAGEEEVDGRDLDHYELTMDVATAFEAIGVDLPPAAMKELPESLTYDVWLDEEDRFGKMSMEMPVQGQSMTTEMTADDWGTDVSIEAPPADQVTEMPDPSQMRGSPSPSPTA